MRFNEALRKATLEFKQKFLGECLNGEHCPEGVGPGLIPHPLDPAGGLHTGNWLHEAQHRGVGIDPLLHGNIGGVTAWQHHGHYERYILTLFELDGTGISGNTAAYYAPIVIPLRCTIDRIGIVCRDPCSGNFELALYNQVNEAPTTQIVTSGAVAVIGISRRQQLTISDTVLDPNLYYVGFRAYVTNLSWGSITQQAGATILPANVDHGPSWYYQIIGAGPLPASATPIFVDDVSKAFFHWIRVKSIG